MKKTKLPKGPDFFLSEEAIQVITVFLEKKDPSIIGETCQMLSALKILLSPTKGLKHLYEITEEMKQDDSVKLSEEKWNDLPLDALVKYLPKVREKRKWIYSINIYIINQLINRLTTEARRKRREVPLSFINKEDGEEYDHPELKEIDLIREIEGYIDVNKAYEEADLTEEEKEICNYRMDTWSKKDIGDKQGRHPKTIGRKIVKIKKKLETVRSQYIDEL